MTTPNGVALVVGAGDGRGSAVARRFARGGYTAVLARPTDCLLTPGAIAENYWTLHAQPRSAWTHELDLRPWVEKF